MITYDDETDRLIFPNGKQVYCFGGNPGIGLGDGATLNYSYGSDGGFSVKDIGISNAILMAAIMEETWKAHKEYLKSLGPETLEVLSGL